MSRRYGLPPAQNDPRGDLRATFLASLEYGVNPLVGRDATTTTRTTTEDDAR